MWIVVVEAVALTCENRRLGRIINVLCNGDGAAERQCVIAAPHDDVEDDEGSRTGGERRHGWMRWRAAADAEAVVKGGGRRRTMMLRTMKGVDSSCSSVVVVLVWWRCFEGSAMQWGV